VSVARPPVPPTPKGRQTEKAFLDAARLIMARDGYANAKISDMAAVAGKSLGSFYNYFDSKEHILEVLAERFRAEVLRRGELVDRSLPPDEYAAAGIRVYWEACRDHSAELSAIFQASMMDRRFAARWREIRSVARDFFARSIVRIQRGGLCAGMDPDVAASAFCAMIDYFCYVWIVGGGEFRTAALDEDMAIDTLVQIWLRTVRSAGPARLARPGS
jgi:AcrR family transcriptional regulator